MAKGKTANLLSLPPIRLRVPVRYDTHMVVAVQAPCPASPAFKLTLRFLV